MENIPVTITRISHHLMYNLRALESTLSGTIFPGRLHYSSTTNSTSIDALAAARNGAPHGTVFFADQQLAGRGRSDHAWQSPAAEGLYVSVLLRPQIPVQRLTLLPLAAGLAATTAIHSTTCLPLEKKVDLRWPNDLLIGHRKLGGILVEAKTEAGAVSYAVVGIGINVHQRSFDPGLSTPATSLDLESGTTNSRQSLLIALLTSLEAEGIALESSEAPQSIPRRVEAASTWIRGRAVHVRGPQACTGITAGLDANGFLLVQTPHALVTVHTGGIRAAQTESEI